MITKIFTFLVAATFISSLSFATIRRVGYAGTSLTGVDFTDFKTAHDDSSAGDTIQIYGSDITGTITNQLVIIGFGYNFDVHPDLQVIGTDAPSSANLSFGPGSDGSIATGLSGSFSIGDQSGTHITVSNISFLRCFGQFYLYNYQSYSLCSNIKIISSVILGGGMQSQGDADYPVENLQVFNCYVANFTLYKTTTTASFFNCVMGSPSIVGAASLSLNNASVLVKNCILAAAGTTQNINTIFENNFFGEVQPAVLPAGSNNRWGQVWSVLFTRITNANDYASSPNYTEFDENYFVLKAGSPAINGGFNSANAATNCGIFGGEPLYVYKPGGVPSVPAIYKLTAPTSSAGTNPYNVTISVKSNN